MGGQDFSFNPRDDELDESGHIRGTRLKTTGRPDYTHLWRKAGRLVTLPEPIADAHLEAWAEALGDVEETLLYLTSDNPGSHLAPTGDTQTEQRLVISAHSAAHDFLRLYAEVIQQPPPEDLQQIEQLLRHRKEALESLHPRPSRPPSPECT